MTEGNLPSTSEADSPSQLKRRSIADLQHNSPYSLPQPHESSLNLRSSPLLKMQSLSHSGKESSVRRKLIPEKTCGKFFIFCSVRHIAFVNIFQYSHFSLFAK